MKLICNYARDIISFTIIISIYHKSKMKKSYNLSLFFFFFFLNQLKDKSFGWHVNYSTRMYLTVYLHKLVSHPSTNLWIRIVYVNLIFLLSSWLGKARDTTRAASSSIHPTFGPQIVLRWLLHLQCRSLQEYSR